MLVDPAEFKNEVFSRPLHGQFKFTADPDSAISCQPLRGPEAGNIEIDPGRIVKLRLCPAESLSLIAGIAFDLRTEPGRDDFSDIRGFPDGISRDPLFILLNCGSDIRIADQRIAAGPCFNDRAAPGTCDNADRNSEPLPQFAAEPERHRRKRRRILRIRIKPFPFKRILRSAGGTPPNGQHTERGRIMILRQKLFQLIGRTPHRESHVGLSGSKPDFPDQNIANLDFFPV